MRTTLERVISMLILSTIFSLPALRDQGQDEEEPRVQEGDQEDHEEKRRIPLPNDCHSLWVCECHYQED